MEIKQLIAVAGTIGSVTKGDKKITFINPLTAIVATFGSFTLIPANDSGAGESAS